MTGKKHSKKFKIILSIILALIAAGLIFITVRMITAPTDLKIVQTYALPEFPNIETMVPQTTTEKLAIAIDGQPAYDNTKETQPTASTAKILTALMVIDKHPLNPGETGPNIEITQEFYDRYAYYIAHNGSNTPVVIGEQISEYDALASMLLPSSNNMADTLAIWAFGSLDAYKSAAEAKLKEWGLTQTTIGIDASGFSDTTTSSASDLALLGQKLMNNPTLAEIVGTQSKVVPVAGEIKNTNKLLGESNIIGVKTGFIGDPSGYCLVSAYKQNDHIITTTTLNSPTRDASFATTKSLTDSLQQNLIETTIATKDQELGYYESWWQGKTPIISDDDISILAWSSATHDAKLAMSDTPDTQNPNGTLTITNGSATSDYPIHADSLQPEPSFLDRLKYALFLK